MLGCKVTKNHEQNKKLREDEKIAEWIKADINLCRKCVEPIHAFTTSISNGICAVNPPLLENLKLAKVSYTHSSLKLQTYC